MARGYPRGIFNNVISLERGHRFRRGVFAQR